MQGKSTPPVLSGNHTVDPDGDLAELDAQGSRPLRAPACAMLGKETPMPSTGTGSTRIDAARGTVAGQQSRTACTYFPRSRTVRRSVQSALTGGARRSMKTCGERDDRGGSA
jgi:hypothetical protein